jgi:hypothetical protein
VTNAHQGQDGVRSRVFAMPGTWMGHPDTGVTASGRSSNRPLTTRLDEARERPLKTL